MLFFKIWTKKGRKRLLWGTILLVITSFGVMFIPTISIVSVICYFGLLLLLYFSTDILNKVTFYSSNHEKLDDKQKEELEKAKKEWEEHGKEEFLKETEKEIKRYQNEIVSTSKKIITCNEKIDSMDILGRDEKQIKIIDMLIYFIESHRADNIKEALHEYDDAITRQELIRLEQEKNAMIQQHNNEMQRLAEESARIQERMLNEQREHNAQMQTAQQIEAIRQREYESQMKRIAEDNASSRARLAENASYIANQMALNARDSYYR